MRRDGRVGFGLHTGMPVEDIVKYAREAEEKGFDSIWLSEDVYFRDALPIMSSLAHATKKTKLATCIVNFYTKNPVYMAMAAATLDEISGGRLILGIGRGVKSIIEVGLGIEYKSPLNMAREYITVLRRLLKGDVVEYTGKQIKVKGAQLRFKPLRKDIPIYLAAMGPKTLQLAGRLADGVIFNSCSSPEYVKYALEHVRIGAEDAGRSVEDVDVACGIWLSVHEESKKAIEVVKPSVAFLLSIPTFGELILEKNGYDTTILQPMRKALLLEDESRDPFWCLEHGDIKTAQEYISDALVRRLTASGTVDECRRRIEEFRRAGVKIPLLFPLGEDPTTPLKLL